MTDKTFSQPNENDQEAKNQTNHIAGVSEMDLISKQAAIDAIKGLPTWWADAGGYYGDAQPPMEAMLDPEDVVSAIENLPPAQPEDCSTCKHGHFGDRQCNYCRVRYLSHYERDENE